MKRVFASILSIVLFAFIMSGQSSAISTSQNDPTLMKINGKEIALSEFEYIYNKNNSANVIDKKSLTEYVDLFVIFKLKVEEAIAQGIDTTAAFRSELGMYRNQLAEQYLQDEKWADELVREAYERRETEVNVSHILIRIDEKGTTSDTLKAYNKAMEVYKRALKEDFVKLAREVSEDNSVEQNDGLVGWITSMRTPYSFESVAYNTSKGQIAKPVRTAFGYHILKVNDVRKSQGEVKVAHIMLMDNEQNPDPENSVKQKERIDSIYNRLLAGDDFASLATQLSEDRGSAQQNGELPWFGSGRMVPEFEVAAFSIENKGEVIAPVKSPYGWHIIKLIDKRGLAPFEEMEKNLISQIERSDNSAEKANAFTNKLKKEYHFNEVKAALQQFIQLSDRYALNDSLYSEAIAVLSAPLFSFADKVVTQAEFTKFITPTLKSANGVRADFIKKQYNSFVNDQLIDYERSQLSRKYPDYRNLMQEYHDGILLFDVMNKEVWEKASQDSAGLTSYFTNNKSHYNWDQPRYKGRVIQAKDKGSLKAAKRIVKRAEEEFIDNYINSRLNDSIQYVKVEKGLWTKGDNKFVDQKIFKTDKLTPDNEYPYLLFKGKLLKNPEEYKDVRGTITADYQDYLEKVWVESLKNKFTVEIDEEVLKQVKTN